MILGLAPKEFVKATAKNFRHSVTGTLLTKLQHPETEIYWGSKHEQAGLDCKDYHMPKGNDKKGGKAQASIFSKLMGLKVSDEGIYYLRIQGKVSIHPGDELDKRGISFTYRLQPSL